MPARLDQQEAIDQLKELAYKRGHGRRCDGLDVNTLSRYEHGRIRRPRPPLPILFAALYQAPVEELFPPGGPPAPPATGPGAGANRQQRHTRGRAGPAGAQC